MRILDHSVEQLRADIKAVDAKLDRSVEQQRADTKAVDEKLDRSVERINTKLDSFHALLYIINGSINRLIGRFFGGNGQLQINSEEEQISVEL